MTLPSRHWRSEAEHATSRSRMFPPLLNLYRWAGKKHFVSLKLGGQSGVRTRDLQLSKQAALTTAPLRSQGPTIVPRDHEWKGWQGSKDKILDACDLCYLLRFIATCWSVADFLLLITIKQLTLNYITGSTDITAHCLYIVPMLAQRHVRWTSFGNLNTLIFLIFTNTFYLFRFHTVL